MIKRKPSLKKNAQNKTLENSSKKEKEVQAKKNTDKPVETPKKELNTNLLPPKKDPKEIQKLLNDLNKKFGTNAVRMGSEIKQEVIQRIPTGSIALDISLGGGIPVGRFTQISGALSSTKTTQSLHILKNAQNMGLVPSLFDVEGTTDEAYLRTIGIDPDTLIYSRPDGLEECT